MRQIGFFEQFKGADTVLVSTTAEDAAALAVELERFAQSQAAAVEVSAAPVPGHEAKLMAVREPRASSDREFRWLCGRFEVPQIIAKLKSLATAGAGHQYFELCGSPVQLMVSVGEYVPKKDG